MKNHLTVEETAIAGEVAPDDRSAGIDSDDATTARVRSRLMANKNLNGLAIDVNTVNSDVFLSGQVPGAEERQLAGLIARNTRDVHSVINDLTVVQIETSATMDG